MDNIEKIVDFLLINRLNNQAVSALCINTISK